jgi:hypothetical protein
MHNWSVERHDPRSAWKWYRISNKYCGSQSTEELQPSHLGAADVETTPSLRPIWLKFTGMISVMILTIHTTWSKKIGAIKRKSILNIS